jgi:hypothetical protein
MYKGGTATPVNYHSFSNPIQSQHSFHLSILQSFPIEVSLALMQ